MLENFLQNKGQKTESVCVPVPRLKSPGSLRFVEAALLWPPDMILGPDHPGKQVAVTSLGPISRAKEGALSGSCPTLGRAWCVLRCLANT